MQLTNPSRIRSTAALWLFRASLAAQQQPCENNKNVIEYPQALLPHPPPTTSHPHPFHVANYAILFS